MATRILVVEDEPDIVEVLEYNLGREGYTVDSAARGDEALDAVRRQAPDLIVLDLMLPGLDGLEVLRTLRRDRATERLPVLLLTARGEEIDRVVGLELGADDYVTKPFSPRELTLRVKAILRRRESAPEEGERIDRGDVVLDLAGHRVLVEGEPVALTATEFRLLKLLMERRDRVQTREQLLSEAWGYSEDVDSRTVDTHVRRLRRKLGPAAERIETVIGVGYRFRD
ncbi:MAG: response regulator transcription factor [Thermoanaerobaculia bacterium]